MRPLHRTIRQVKISPNLRGTKDNEKRALVALDKEGKFLHRIGDPDKA